MLPFITTADPYTLGPAQLLHCQTGIPDLRHVPDLVPPEVHHVHIVGFYALASCRAGTAGASMCAEEDAVGADILPLVVSRERLQLVSSVGKRRQQPLHPVRV